MTDPTPELETVLEMALNLSADDRLQLMERLKSSLETDKPSEAASNDNFMLMMIEASDRLGLSADRDDISENFDEELRKTWGEHFDRKWNSDDSSD